MMRNKKFNATRENIRAYVKKNPCATYREIMRMCGVSSTSLVAYHLSKIREAPSKCPVCKGTGHVPKPHKQARDRASEKKLIARTLREAGYSMRQIQDFIGWKSVQSVTAALRD